MDVGGPFALDAKRPLRGLGIAEGRDAFGTSMCLTPSGRLRRAERQSCRSVEQASPQTAPSPPDTQKPPCGGLAHLAEREGFEPSVRLHVRLISSQVHSTTLPPLRSPGHVAGAVHDTGRGIPEQEKQLAAGAATPPLNPCSPAIPPSLAACPFPPDHAVQAGRDNRIQTNRAP